MILYPMTFESRKEGHFLLDQRRGVQRLFNPSNACLLIAVFVGLLYLNSLGNQFTNWDDGMIYQNPNIRNLNWGGIKKIFEPGKTGTYQPVRILSYAIDYKFWNLNPLGYRITNILSYILTCVMVFFTLRLLSSHLRKWRPFDSYFRVLLFGSLFFASHPVHV